MRACRYRGSCGGFHVARESLLSVCDSVSRPYLSRSVFYRIQRFQHCKISPRLPVLRQTPPVPSPAPGRRGVDGWDESWSPVWLSGRPRKGIWRLYRDFGQVRGFF